MFLSKGGMKYAHSVIEVIFIDILRQGSFAFDIAWYFHLLSNIM
jgi:hypothetical protein